MGADVFFKDTNSSRSREGGNPSGIADSPIVTMDARLRGQDRGRSYGTTPPAEPVVSGMIRMAKKGNSPLKKGISRLFSFSHRSGRYLTLFAVLAALFVTTPATADTDPPAAVPAVKPMKPVPADAKVVKPGAGPAKPTAAAAEPAEPGDSAIEAPVAPIKTPEDTAGTDAKPSAGTPADTAAKPTPVPKAGKPDAGAAPPPPPDEPLVSAIPKDRMPKIKLEVAPKTVTVGEVVHWRLEVVRRKEDRVHLPSTASFGGLEIKSKDKREAPPEGDWVRETLEVSLVAFEPGDIVVPAQKLTAVDVDGNLSELETKEAHVTVKSLIANEPEPALKEDAGPGEVVMEKDYLMLWIAGTLAAIGLVVLLTLIGMKLWSMRKPKAAPPPPPPRPAEEIALEKLEALKRSTLLEEDKIKEFHVRLSEAVREYIGNRYGFDSLELSSEELILALRKVSITKVEYDMVLDFLGETDLVKFAKVLPTVIESKDLLDQSFGFVDRTTPKVRDIGEKTAAPGEGVTNG